jgi:signal transduction histidine kinase/ActR/RegA family two-component response regulator
MYAHFWGQDIAHVNRRGGIRWHLFQVQLITIVPIGLFAAALLYLHWQVQEHERQRSQVESVRLLAAAVDNSLDSSVERLSIFARLWSSSSPSEEGIYAQAKEALKVNADWANILAFDAAGRGVFRADAPFGAEMPPGPRFEVWRPVFADRRPVISDLVIATGRTVQTIAVGVPVIRGGKVSHVLIAELELSWYDRLLTQPGLPAGAVAGFFDRNFDFVSRSTEGDARRGQGPSPALVADMKRQPEGVARYTNLNGTAVYTAWTFSRHGWGVGFATPSAPVDDAFWHHLFLFGFLWAMAVGAGTLYAFRKARPIATSLESLEAQAQHIATGGRIESLPDSSVEEVNRALVALEKASGLLQSTMRERDRSLETEREARAAAEMANRAKDEFLAMLGHELRNPVAAIASAATIVKSEGRSAEQLEFAGGVIERQSRHLKRLMDDLLDVGRAMTGKVVLERTAIELAASTRYVVKVLQTAGQLGERLVQQDTTPVWVTGDPARIEQIVTNLLVNAARYTTRSGGEIRIRVAREGDDAVLEVSDNGQGIAPENLQRVFDLFFQAEATGERSTGGLGVGLTLVQHLARLHGGDVTAESKGRGTGASFTVRLPAMEAPEPLPRNSAPTPSGRAETILVVEDNADARESLCIALELQGHRVLGASDGPAALDIVRRERPRVAVLDIGLPGMDGYELARRVRAESGGEIILIALTGYGTARDENRARQAGFDRHVTKPIDVIELTRILEVELAKRSTI